MHIVIDGIVRTRAPLHISAPERNLRYDAERGRFLRGERGGFPCTPMRTLEVLAPGAADETNPIGAVRVPVLPANGLRGRLRRLAAAEIEDHLVHQRGEQLPFVTYQAMHSGAITGNPEGTPPSLDEVRQFRSHPFVGLFGGGPRMVPSRLRVASGYPLVDALFDLGMIPDAFRAEPGVIAASQAWRLLEAIPLNRTDDALQLRDAHIEEVVQDYAEAMIGELARAANRKARKLASQADDAEPIGLQFLSFVQAVITGTPFYVRFALDGEPAQGGLLLAALRRLVAQEEARGIGGKSSIGFGAFGHDLMIDVDGEKARPFATQSTLDVDHPIVAELIGAYEAFLASVSAQSLFELLEPRERART